VKTGLSAGGKHGFAVLTWQTAMARKRALSAREVDSIRAPGVHRSCANPADREIVRPWFGSASGWRRAAMAKKRPESARLTV
jgi:hypothetical protein